jgi:hypothetical protein
LERREVFSAGPFGECALSSEVLDSPEPQLNNAEIDYSFAEQHESTAEASSFMDDPATRPDSRWGPWILAADSPSFPYESGDLVGWAVLDEDDFALQVLVDGRNVTGGFPESDPETPGCDPETPVAPETPVKLQVAATDGSRASFERRTKPACSRISKPLPVWVRGFLFLRSKTLAPLGIHVDPRAREDRETAPVASFFLPL